MIEAKLQDVIRTIQFRATDLNNRGAIYRVVYTCKTKNNEDEFIAEPFENVEIPEGTKEIKLSIIHIQTNQNVFTEFYKIAK